MCGKRTKITQFRQKKRMLCGSPRQARGGEIPDCMSEAEARLELSRVYGGRV